MGRKKDFSQPIISLDTTTETDNPQQPEVLLPVTNSPNPNELTYAIVSNGNKWQLVELRFSMNSNLTTKTVIREEEYKSIIIEAFKIKIVEAGLI